ncbi:MAG: hypothetical protein KC731_06905, partial [Myxococcales bacterium]|nr:hypothetical protein [Myxococcales bacterium]
VLVASGALLGYFGLVSPLLAAEAGKAEVRTSLKATLFAPTALLLGLLLVALPPRLFARGAAPTWLVDADSRRLGLGGYVLVGALLLLGLALHVWVQSRLSELGYA